MNWQKHKAFYVPLIILAVTIVVAIFGQELRIDSYDDLLFESATLMVLTYIYLLLKDSLSRNLKLDLGFCMLLLSKFYDVATESDYLAEFIKNYNMLDSFLEDGTLQAAYLLIAFGATDMTRKLKMQSIKDEMTGLYNRKKLTDLTLDEFQLIYFDLDGLKAINDEQGHSEGDRYITRFAHALEMCLERGEDALRVGGDEFLVILHPGRADNYLQRLAGVLMPYDVGYSYGIQNANKDNLEQALHESDKAMYKMKKSKPEEPDQR